MYNNKTGITYKSVISVSGYLGLQLVLNLLSKIKRQKYDHSKFDVDLVFAASAGQHVKFTRWVIDFNNLISDMIAVTMES